MNVIKKILIVLLIIPVILMCGFKRKEKPLLVMTTGAITKENIERIEWTFNAGERINYAIIAPDGLKYAGVRMQISSQDIKTSNWGFKIYQTQDLYIDTSTEIYKNYIVIQRPGHYIIQFFYLNDKNYPFIHREFTVI